MLQTVEGVYHEGKIDLLEPAPNVSHSRVIVTFLLSEGPVDLQARGIDEAQAADLRARLRTFEEDWNRPEMDIYDAD
jgi:hypothetical protein